MSKFRVRTAADIPRRDRGGHTFGKAWAFVELDDAAAAAVQGDAKLIKEELSEAAYRMALERNPEAAAEVPALAAEEIVKLRRQVEHLKLMIQRRDDEIARLRAEGSGEPAEDDAGPKIDESDGEPHARAEGAEAPDDDGEPRAVPPGFDAGNRSGGRRGRRG
jgi:hypothetical protein